MVNLKFQHQQFPGFLTLEPEQLFQKSSPQIAYSRVQSLSLSSQLLTLNKDPTSSVSKFQQSSKQFKDKIVQDLLDNLNTSTLIVRLIPHQSRKLSQLKCLTAQLNNSFLLESHSTSTGPSTPLDFKNKRSIESRLLEMSLLEKQPSQFTSI